MAAPHLPPVAGDTDELRDLTIFNRWLSVSRLRATVAVAAFLTFVQALGIGGLSPLPVFAVCAGLAVFSLVLLRYEVGSNSPWRLFLGQTAVDLLGVTLGIGFAVGGLAALLLRGIFILVIVPCSLVSVRAGLLVATGAAVAHEVLLGLDRGFSWELLATLESMVPVFLFFVIAQQCFFYAEHLKEKNKSLAELASRLTLSQRRLGGLVRVARTLNSTMEAEDLLSRVNQSALSELYADWSATFLVDSAAKTFRLGAMSGDELGMPGESHADLPLDAWPVLERLQRERIFMLEGEDIESGSTLADGRSVARFLVAGLYSDDDLTGFMALAYCLGHEKRAAAASEQLRPIAEHATIALRNSQLLDEARQASRLKSDFVSTMSHELRTPLNVIIGYSEMLRDGAAGPLSVEQRELFDQIDVQSRELYDLIEATLQVGRIETGSDDLRRFRIPMADLVGAMQSVTARLPRPDGVAVEWETQADEAAALNSDLGKVSLILRNLVSNAFKFTKQGRVVIRIDAAGDELLLEVADTGIGISPSDLPRMFEMFRQLDSATTRVHGGVGLGLYIVKQMVDRLGGRIDVESAPGEGATFRIWLPGYEAPASVSGAPPPEAKPSAGGPSGLGRHRPVSPGIQSGLRD